MSTSNRPPTGRVALGTGASSGIGGTTALAHAESGACVALVARRAEESAALPQQIGALGVRWFVAGFAVTEPGAVQTELNDHLTDAGAQKASGDDHRAVDSPKAEDIAAATGYAATRPDRVAVNEALVRPTDQTQP